MKGDFSRIRLSKKREREKNYRKVLFQQGRVLTDSDVNAYVEMIDQQNIKSLRDIIGKSGVPLEQKQSFEIKPIEGTNRYTIGKGRMYVDGIQIENFYDVEAFSVDGKVQEQPYLPSVLDNGQPISDAVPKEPGIYLAYLVVYDGHKTVLDDPDLRESALGDSDTSTCVQTVWQVKLHKMKYGEDINEENKWAPWIRLENEDDIPVDYIKIGSNNDGSLLEVFAVPPDRTKGRKSRRQSKLVPVEWESEWQSSGEEWRFVDFDIASKHVDDLEILHTVGKEDTETNFRYFIRNDKISRWGTKEVEPESLFSFNYKLVMNAKNSLELFVIGSITDPDGQDDHFRLYHSKKEENSSVWEGWRQIYENEFFRFSVIFNPDNDLIEIYAIELLDIERLFGRIWYTKQKKPDSIEWEPWNKINQNNEPGAQLLFNEIVVGLNRYNQVVIFAREQEIGKVWSTIRTERDFPNGNGWSIVGDNQPGTLILREFFPPSRTLSVQNNPKKDHRLEVFGIFSDDGNSPEGETPNSGKIWNIFEDEDGKWNSKWKIINEQLEVTDVASATDKKSRVNIFAIESERRIVHHSYLEDEISCENIIPSWETKIKPSIIQLKARTRVQTPLHNDQCLLPEQAGYRRLENHLYRIEIHDPKSESKNATFKFSRDNGTVYSKVLNISDNKITVASIGRDSLLGFSSNHWVEITDDLHTLWGIPGILAHIEDIDVDGTELIFGSTIPFNAKIDNDSFPQRFNPIARRWDSDGALDVEIPLGNNGWIEIEDGIQVKFNNIDSCKTGDHWTTAARTSKADIEWPKGPDGVPEFVDIEGIEYHYTKLALLDYTHNRNLKLISDCREFFPPLNTLDDLSSELNSVICWVHGTISEVEFPTTVQIRKEAAGSTYRRAPNQTNDDFNWFHFPITNSYPVDPHKKISLEEMYILFETDDDAKIIQIDIYDGRNKKIDFPDLVLRGSHGNSPDKDNTFIFPPEQILVNQGIGISIRVLFRSDEPTNQITTASITFNSIGIRLKVH